MARVSSATGDCGAEGIDDAVAFDPFTVRISVAVKLTGISRSRLYELIRSGDIETVKIGRSSLVLYRSLKRLVGL